jgi:predicted transcriptional regulator
LMSGVRLQETVNFREDTRILKVVDEIAMIKGTDRSALYREAIRFWLRHEQNRDIKKILEDSKTRLDPRL